jgi:hypothetical protein
MINSPVDCGNPELAQFIKSSTRSVSKDWLGPIKRDGKMFCAWCNKKELTKKRSKYCSHECLETSSAYCYPQTNSQSFFFLFQKQNKQCADCKFDYGPTLEALKKDRLKFFKIRIKNKIEKMKTMNISEAAVFKKAIEKEIQKFKAGLLAPYPFDAYTPKKIRKHHRKSKDHRQPEVDHIVPIGAGGSALGFENLQLLCFKCHKTKTSRDMVHIRALKKQLGQNLQSA